MHIFSIVAALIALSSSLPALAAPCAGSQGVRPSTRAFVAAGQQLYVAHSALSRRTIGEEVVSDTGSVIIDGDVANGSRFSKVKLKVSKLLRKIKNGVSGKRPATPEAVAIPPVATARTNEDINAVASSYSPDVQAAIKKMIKDDPNRFTGAFSTNGDGSLSGEGISDLDDLLSGLQDYLRPPTSAK